MNFFLFSSEIFIYVYTQPRFACTIPPKRTIELPEAICILISPVKVGTLSVPASVITCLHFPVVPAEPELVSLLF